MERSVHQCVSPRYHGRFSQDGSLKGDGSLTTPLLSQPLSSGALLENSAELGLAGGAPEPAVSVGAVVLDQPRRCLSQLLALAGPLLLQNLFSYSSSVIASAFIGHLSDPTLLASVVLAGSFYNVTGYSLVVGLAAGMDTLCGQAFGAGHNKTLGLVLQRALLICLTSCIPVMVLWWHAPAVLSFLVGAQPEVVAGAARYLWMIVPALIGAVFSTVVGHFQVAQSIVLPGLACTVITSMLCLLYNYVLVIRWGLALDGAAYALCLTSWTYALLLSGATVQRELRTAGTDAATWPGLTSACFRGWFAFLSYGIPAALQICLEWWCFELVIFMAGHLHSAHDSAVAAVGVAMNTAYACYMFPMSLGGATTTLVANALGGNRPHAARSAFVTALSVGACIQVCICAGLITGRHVLPLVFTNNAEVSDMVTHVLPVLAGLVLGDGMNAIAGPVLRASGRQGLAACLNIVGYYGIGIPTALLLGFHYQLGIWGLWMGLAIASTLQAVIQVSVISNFNWRRECERAAQLVASCAVELEAEEERQRASHAQAAARAWVKHSASSSALAGSNGHLHHLSEQQGSAHRRPDASLRQQLQHRARENGADASMTDLMVAEAGLWAVGEGQQQQRQPSAHNMAAAWAELHPPIHAGHAPAAALGFGLQEQPVLQPHPEQQQNE